MNSALTLCVCALPRYHWASMYMYMRGEGRGGNRESERGETRERGRRGEGK